MYIHGITTEDFHGLGPMNHILVHETPTQIWEVVIGGEGTGTGSHVGRVLRHENGLAYKASVMAGNYPLSIAGTVVQDAVPLTALIQGF